MLDKRTLDTIRSQADAGEFAHYGGIMVQDLLNHIDALTEQVRVLDTYVSLVNMLRDIVQDADRPVMGLDANNTYEVGSDLIDRARRALAALEGES